MAAFLSQALETPYVVKLHNALPLTEAKECFTFVHPNPAVPDHVDNARFRTMAFALEKGATLHG